MPENPTPSGLLQPDAANNGNAGAGAIDALSLFRRLSSATVATSFQPSQRDQFGGQIYNRSNTNLANLATQLGYSAIGSGNRSTAVGSFAYAREDSAVALGVYALALGPSSVAIGDQALSSGYRSITIGNQGQGNALGAISIGFQARALGVNSIAIGSQAYAIGANAISIGASARTVAAYSIALGALASVPVSNSPGALAIGANANVTGAFGAAIALGAGATVLGTLSPAIAIGSNATVTSPGREGIAIGTNALVSARGAQAYGEATTASFTDSVAFGRATITTSTNQMMIGNPTYPLSMNISGPTPWVDVIAHGADPTAVSDSATAFASAYANLTGSGTGVVYFPRGVYVTSASMTPRSGVTFRGAGPYSTSVIFTGTGSWIDLGATAVAQDFALESIMVTCSGSIGAIRCGRTTEPYDPALIRIRWVLRDVFLRGDNTVNSIGISAVQYLNWTLDNVTVLGFEQPALWYQGGNSLQNRVRYWAFRFGAKWFNSLAGCMDQLNVVEHLGPTYGGVAGVDYGDTCTIDAPFITAVNCLYEPQVASLCYIRIASHGGKYQDINGLFSGGTGTGIIPTNTIVCDNGYNNPQFFATFGGPGNNAMSFGTTGGTGSKASFINCYTEINTLAKAGGLTKVNVFGHSAETVYEMFTENASYSSNIKFTTSGSGIYFKEGSTNPVMGIVTLSGAGTAIVYTTKLTTASRVFLTPENSSGTAGAVYVSTSTSLVSFTVASTSAADTRTVAWVLFEPS